MDERDLAPATPFDDHRGARQHRFMESADINAAFREVFSPLRTNIRRGMRIEGQLYALEVDACIPGELLAAAWIPPASYGIDGPDALADAARRAALFDRLLAETRVEALFAYVCEQADTQGSAVLSVEIVSVDACHVAEYPIGLGSGWHLRELLPAQHRRHQRLALS